MDYQYWNDPKVLTETDANKALEIYKANFLQNYKNNKAPVIFRFSNID